MIRILHLLDTQAEFQTRRGVEMLARNPGDGFSVDIQKVGSRAAAVYQLRKNRENVDVVHAWGTNALTVAAMGARSPIMYGAEGVTSKKAVSWIRAVGAYRDVKIICPTETSRRIHIESGVEEAKCEVVRPGVDFSRVKRRRDEALRERLGFGQQDRVILAAGEHRREENHLAAVWTTGILNKLDPRYRLLLWGRGKQSRYLTRFGKSLELGENVVVAGEEMQLEDLLTAGDVVLETAKGQTQALPICICMAAGVPIISSVTYTMGELLEDRRSALMVGSASPRLLAKRVSELFDDERMKTSIAETARAEAYEFFPMTRFLAGCREVYRQAVGQGVGAR